MNDHTFTVGQKVQYRDWGWVISEVGGRTWGIIWREVEVVKLGAKRIQIKYEDDRTSEVKIQWCEPKNLKPVIATSNDNWTGLKFKWDGWEYTVTGQKTINDELVWVAREDAHPNCEMVCGKSLVDMPRQTAIIPISECMTLRESTFRTPTRPQTTDHTPTYVRSPKPKGYRNDKVVYAREDISVANNVYILKGTPGRIETCGAWALNVKFEGHRHAMLCTYDMVSEVKPRELKKLHNSPFKTGQVVTITTQGDMVGVVDNIRFDGVHFIQTQDTERFKYGVCAALEWELKTVAIVPAGERRTLIDVCWNAPNPVFQPPQPHTEISELDEPHLVTVSCHICKWVHQAPQAEALETLKQHLAVHNKPIEPLPINCAECGQPVGLETVVHNKKTYCMDCGEPKLREEQDETLFLQKLSDAPDEDTPAPRVIEQPPQPEIPMKQLSLFGD
jgi:hypothetical protein